MIATSWPLCTAIAALALAAIVIGLWIDWKLNWRKGRHEPGRERQGFDVIPAGGVARPRDARDGRHTVESPTKVPT